MHNCDNLTSYLINTQLQSQVEYENENKIIHSDVSAKGVMRFFEMTWSPRLKHLTWIEVRYIKWLKFHPFIAFTALVSFWWIHFMWQIASAIYYSCLHNIYFFWWLNNYWNMSIFSDKRIWVWFEACIKKWHNELRLALNISVYWFTLINNLWTSQFYF